MKTSIIGSDGKRNYYISNKTKGQLQAIVCLYDLKQSYEQNTLPLGEHRLEFVIRIVNDFIDEFLTKYQEVPSQKIQDKFLNKLFLREVNNLGL